MNMTLEAPAVAWPRRITEEQARAWATRRLPRMRQARFELYHHPMAGVQFAWRRRLGGTILAHALVDLVGGRAYLSEPWDDITFLPLRAEGPEPLSTTSSVHGPGPRLTGEEAESAARTLIDSVLLRRRRLDSSGTLHRVGDVLCFGKPNWWVTGRFEGRDVEVVIDGLTGSHYVFRG